MRPASIQKGARAGAWFRGFVEAIRKAVQANTWFLHAARRRTASSAVGDKFWLLPADELANRLHASPGGIDERDAARRLVVYGRNALAHAESAGLARRIWRRLTEPLVAILAVAACLSGFFGDGLSAGFILIVLGLSIGLDLAERAVDGLRQSVAIMVDVVRSGCPMRIVCDEVVPGDVVRLKAGDLIPADGLVLSCTNGHANETVLTGEAYPVANQRQGGRWQRLVARWCRR